MDDTTLAFMVYAADHSDALAHLQALSEAEALEAGDLRLRQEQRIVTVRPTHLPDPSN